MLLRFKDQGVYVAQSVIPLALALGHDLMVHVFEPPTELYADGVGVKPAWDFLSLPLSLNHPPLHTLSQNKINLKNKKTRKECVTDNLNHLAQVLQGSWRWGCGIWVFGLLREDGNYLPSLHACGCLPDGRLEN